MDFSERIFDDDFEFNDTSKKILSRYKGSDLKVMVPDSVIEIGENAFEGCISLEEITIPGSVIKIGNNAFRECSNLKEITISTTFIEIGENAFEGCNDISIFCFRDSYAGQYAIEHGINCEYLKSFVDYVYDDDDILFFDVNNHHKKIKKNKQKFENKDLTIKEIIINNSFRIIDDRAFSGCRNLKKIGIPDSIIEIGENAFEGCISLEEIEIPDSVTGIKSLGFLQCNNLKQVKLPNKITFIPSSLFEKCISLKEIEIPDSVTNIEGYAFEKCISLEKIEIPNSVTEIGRYAFVGCSSLKEIKIPNSVYSIGENAFEGCISLEKIEIPDSVTNIGENAFKECKNICIYCHKYSYAVRYAIDNDINYKYLDAKVNDTIYFLEESNDLEKILSILIEKGITHYVYKNNIAIPRFYFCEYKMFIININFQKTLLSTIDIYDNYKTFSQFITCKEKESKRHVEKDYSYNNSSKENYYNERTWNQSDWNEYYTGSPDIDCDPEDYWKD